MAENRMSEGELVTLVGATAASNIAAGCMVGIATGGNAVFSLDRESVGLTNSARAGGTFIGVLDETVVEGQSPITVWTQGVFKFRLNSETTMTGSAAIGKPVFAQTSGGGALVDYTGTTGDQAVGTVVGYDLGIEISCGYVRIKISPASFNWGCFGIAQAGASSGTGYEGHVYPPLT